MATSATGNKFTIRKNLFSALSYNFRIYDPSGGLIGYCRQKILTLKADIRLYTDKSMAEERLVIQEGEEVESGVTFDVIDSKKGKVGTLIWHVAEGSEGERISREKWSLLDDSGSVIGNIQDEFGEGAELRLLKRLLQQFLSGVFPQKFTFRDTNEVKLGDFRNHRNPFVHRMTATILPHAGIAPELSLAAGILLVAVDGRKIDS